MVKEILCFENELTGQIYRTKEEAEKSENEIAALQIANDVAKKYKYNNWFELLEYLKENEEKIKSLRIRLYVRALYKKTESMLTSVSSSKLEKGLDLIIAPALKQINNFKTKVIIEVDGKKISDEEVASFDMKKFGWNNYDPKLMYLDKVEKENDDLYVYKYINYPSKEVMPVIEALKNWNIQEDSYFKEFILEYIDEFTDAEKYYALQSSGVDNWSGYDFARELAEEDNKDWWNLSPEDKLSYLYNAGVDNWSYYSDSLDELRENSEYSDNQILECFTDNEDFFAKYWSNYRNFKFTLYGIEK